jgi:hypothetical protein
MEMVDDEKVKNEEIVNNSVAAKSSNTFVVSDVSEGVVTLVSNCLHVLDFPLSLLPFDVKKGNILQLDICRAIHVEQKRDKNFESLQKNLMKASSR